MNISSILITIVGIIIILALYVFSRVGQNSQKNTESSAIPEIKNEDGEKFTSILDDIPASDGITTSTEEKQVEKLKSKKQIVLFISGKEHALDGNLVKDTLLNNGLKLGDKDIYHYLVTTEEQTNSLFRIANGVEPWTLKDEDLIDKQIIGLSMVMLLPSVINNKEAVLQFMEMADTITNQVQGVLKNQQQEILSTHDRTTILSS